MQKKTWWKGLLCLLFVLGAGIFYFLSGAGEDGGVLKKESDAQKDAAAQENGTERISGAPQKAVEKQAGTAEEGINSPNLLYIHVCGSVKNPGVYQLFENSRVVEAIEAAGGFLPDAAGDYLNQAELLRDGQKIYVPDKAEAEEWEKSGKGQTPEEALASSPYVNINTATVSQLMELDGIGKSKAEAIVAYRERNGRFGACEDLMKVPGIKEAAYEKVRHRITTGD